ncbi:type IX secretion system PorP/SprF family membrane protein [Flavobacterium sp. HSC-32F16]|uniref:PorP/SprF family type IX secretion system membrane protein n=1 Tax=Flavobacterium sp. HSC-32F16 TaxID=2910964 RepID=UPI0020A2F35D|nr:type IX secretion system membrane protein PorP/SprF [Flavobacterium sp. HSC-32F16]MCP2029286.1 type IX secretion system PorP/SprF family membrane protein [Flavobacterium sp. HSC-32F16]
MKIIKNILAGALLLFSSMLFAQQETILTAYRYQMNVINPAYAGADRETILSTTFRKQWTGIENAPETQAVSFGTPIGEKIGIGISMVYDKTFIEKQTQLGIDFSYKLQVGALTDLYLGIKAGGNFYNVNTSGLETYIPQSDPALTNINQFNPNVGVGALLKNDKYFVSLSVPRILNTERAKDKDGYAAVATDKPHVYLSSGYNFDLETTTLLLLKPSFMARYVNGAPISLDLNLMLQIQEFFEIGGSYRVNNAYAGIAAITISQHLTFGYAYEANTGKVMASSKNSNEFFLRFKF